MDHFFTKNYLNKAKKVTTTLVFFGLILLIIGVPATQIQAAEPLRITSITTTVLDKTATISWRTNQPATGKLEYGLNSNSYSVIRQTNLKTSEQSLSISGLEPEMTYYFKVTAQTDLGEVNSFEQTFKTKKLIDTGSPTISRVSVVYTTGTTATIQWYTDEPATTEVDYGSTENYDRSSGDGTMVRIHDITLTGLISGATYHFRVKSKDKNSNTTRWFDMTLRTNITEQADRSELTITEITPVSENDPEITTTGATISWRTNKLAEGTVYYGTSPQQLGSTVGTAAPRDFTHRVALIGLEPNTTYYYALEARDVLGRQVVVEGKAFTTKNDGSVTSQPAPTPRVLGSSTCNVDLKAGQGFFGLYYNLTPAHPDFGTHTEIPIHPTKIADENDWYSDQYFAFDQVDATLNFTNFNIVNSNQPGDPSHFAVHWQAIMDVPNDSSYQYEMTSDDDSWLFIDGKLASDKLGYAHVSLTDTGVLLLTAGLHRIDIYYAERAGGSAVFVFKPDSSLRFYPLPEGCDVEDVVSANQSTHQSTQGTVLGASTEDDAGNGAGTAAPSVYACDPTLGYTKIKALYKTSASPDVWAILETGQKHYITSPASFNTYQCDWSKIRVVSSATLNRYPNASLVRTPQNTAVYHLFSRPDTKWLKIALPSPTVFISYPGNYWGNIARINGLDLAAYPDVKLVKVAAGSNIYLLEGSTKRLIKNESVFERLNFEWAEVATLNQTHLDYYEDGSIVE